MRKERNRLLSIGEACELLGVCRVTLLRYEKKYPDFPPPILVDGRTRRYWLSELNKWIESRRKK